MVKLVWRLSGNVIHHVFSIKTPDKLRNSTYYGDSIILPVILAFLSLRGTKLQVTKV